MSEIDEFPPSGGGARVRFSPTIELGHLLQALVILATVGGWAIVGYYTIQSQIDASARIESTHHTEMQAEMALAKQRQMTNEAAIGELREGLKGATNETRQTLSKILDQIADLRTLVASQNRDVPHR